MLKTLVPIAIAALVLAIGVSQWAYMSRLTEKERIIANSRFPIVGEPAPPFSLPGLSGGQTSLAGLLGRPLVINFWATWCTLCEKEMPVFQELQEREDGQLAVLSICSGSSPEAARAVIEAGGYTFPVLYDANRAVANAYQPAEPGATRQVTAFPFTVFVDADGTVVYARTGIFTSLDGLLDRLRAVEFPVG